MADQLISRLWGARSHRATLHPAVVHQFTEATATGHDVLMVPEPALLLPSLTRHAGEHLGGRHATIDTNGVVDHVDPELRAEIAHAAQELGCDDEVEGDETTRATMAVVAVVTDGSVETAPRRPHRIREEHKGVVDRTTDLRAMQRSAGDAVTVLVLHTSHDEVILADDLGGEHVVERVVADLTRQHAGTGDVHDHRGGVVFDDLARPNATLSVLNHPRGRFHGTPRELVVDDSTNERGVEHSDDRVELRLDSLRTTQATEVGGQEEIIENVNTIPVLVKNFA